MQELKRMTPEEAKVAKRELEIYNLSPKEVELQTTARYWRKKVFSPLIINVSLNLAKSYMANKEFSLMLQPLSVVLNFEKVIEGNPKAERHLKRLPTYRKNRIKNQTETDLTKDGRDEKSFCTILEASYLKTKCLSLKDAPDSPIYASNLRSIDSVLKLVKFWVKKRNNLVPESEIAPEMLKKRYELLKKIEEIDQANQANIAKDEKGSEKLWKKGFLTKISSLDENTENEQKKEPVPPAEEDTTAEYHYEDNDTEFSQLEYHQVPVGGKKQQEASAEEEGEYYEEEEEYCEEGEEVFYEEN